MIIAVDFDGTIVKHKYPDIGDVLPFAIKTLVELTRNGHKLILNTMRSGFELEESVEFLKSLDVDLWGINENPEQYTWTNSPKVYAQIYIDDASLGCPLRFPKNERPEVDWVAVRDYLTYMGFIG